MMRRCESEMSKPRRPARTRKGKPVSLETLWKLALALPGTEEGTSYGTPAFKVRGKLFARLREDGDSLVVNMGFEEREALMQTDPETFYITDHYLSYTWLLVRLSKVRADKLAELLEQAWRRVAPAGLVAAFDARSAQG